MTLVDYKSEIPQAVFEAATRQEETRQALMRGESTSATLKYAKFLSALENDASNGQFYPSDDTQIKRDFPCLAPLLKDKP